MKRNYIPNVPVFPETKQLYVWAWHFLCYAPYFDPTFVYKAGKQTCISEPINAVQFLFLCTPKWKIKKMTTSDILHCLKNFTRFLSLWIILWRRSDHLNPKNCLHILQWSSDRENCFKRNSKWCHRWNLSRNSRWVIGKDELSEIKWVFTNTLVVGT